MTTLVLLPGMDGTGFLFEPFVTALGGRYPLRIVRYPTDKVLDYAELEAIARAALPTDDDFVLLGESFSGPVAINIAASNPRGLVGLVLCVSFVVNPRPGLGWLTPLTNILSFKMLPAWVRNLFLLRSFGNANARALLRNTISAVDARVFNSRLRIIMDMDATAALRRCKVPLLYLQATDDWLVPASALDKVRENFPAVSVVEIVGPHCLLLVSPLPAVAAVSAFIDQLTPAAPTA